MTSQFFQTPSYGGGGGGAFDDIEATPANPPVGIKAIAVRSGAYLDQLAATYDVGGGSTVAPTHGGQGGGPTSLQFVPNEKVIGIQGRSGAYVDQISILTAVIYGGGDPPYLQTYGPYGRGGGAPFQIWGEFPAFYGRSGSFIDAIGGRLSTATAGRGREGGW